METKTRSQAADAIERLCREQGRKKSWLMGQMGMSNDRFFRFMQGRTQLSLEEAHLAAKALGVSLETFVEGLE